MIELRRSKSQVTVSATIWMLTLELAYVCGWKPAGTLSGAASSNSNSDADSLADVRHLIGWQMQYMSSGGQQVSEPDAEALAIALKRAASEGERIMADWGAGRIQVAETIRNDSSGFRWFTTTEGKKHLQNLAGFCRGGAFQIF